MSHNTILPPPGTVLREDIELHDCFKLLSNFILTSAYVLPTDYFPPPGFGYPPGTYLKAGTRLPAGSALLSGAVLPTGYVLPRGSVMPDGAFLGPDHPECRYANNAARTKQTPSTPEDQSGSSVTDDDSDQIGECKNHNETCDFCDKKGLPILPVRYAVAPTISNAPKAEGNLLPQNGGKGIELGSTAHYTTRILRTGYLYVYDEARNRWEAYYISQGGFFMRFDIGDGLSPALTKGREPCSRVGDRELASCITITSPKQATNVWLAYSDVEWTQRVLAQHTKDVAYRAKHMCKIDVKALLASVPTDRPFRPISQLTETVAEYASGVDAKSFAFSSAAWTPREGEATSTAAILNCLYPGKAALVALNDPAGIVTDLASLMKEREEWFLDQKDRRYHLTVNGWLGQIEGQIKDRAQRERLYSAISEREYRQSPYRTPLQSIFSATTRAYEITTAPALSEMDSAEKLDKVAEVSWKTYEKKIDTERRKQWIEQFTTDATRFDEIFIAPLAKAHVEWMKGSTLNNYLGCVFDDENPESGIAYITVVSACVATTDDKKPCQELYTQWLQQNAFHDGNPILNALVYNQKSLKREFNGLSNSVTWELLPWDKFVSIFDQSFQNYAAGKSSDVLGRLLATLAGSLTNVVKTAAQSPTAHKALTAIGVATHQPIIRVEVTGTKRAFRSAFIREMISASGQPVAETFKMHQAVQIELRRLEVYGMSLHGTNKQYWLVMADPESVRDMPKGLSTQQRAKWFAQSIRSPEQMRQLNLAAFRNNVASADARLRNAGEFHAPFAFAVLGLIMNSWAWYHMNEQDKGVMPHLKKEMAARLTAQGAQVFGAAAVALGEGVNKLILPQLSRATGAMSLFARGTMVLGQRASIVGGVAMSFIDGWRAYGELQDGNYVSSFVFAASGGLGLGILAALYVGNLVIAAVLTVVLIAWVFITNHLLDNDMQDWIERGLFGILEGEKRYNDFEKERDMLNIIIDEQVEQARVSEEDFDALAFK